MGATKQISRSQWRPYFERFAERHLASDPPKAATVEVISPRLGDQLEARVVRLLGLGYEPSSNTFEVRLDGVSPLLFYPAEIWVIEEEGGFISALEIVRADGAKEIVYVQRSGPPAVTYAEP